MILQSVDTTVAPHPRSPPGGCRAGTACETCNSLPSASSCVAWTDWRWCAAVLCHHCHPSTRWAGRLWKACGSYMAEEPRRCPGSDVVPRTSVSSGAGGGSEGVEAALEALLRPFLRANFWNGEDLTTLGLFPSRERRKRWWLRWLWAVLPSGKAATKGDLFWKEGTDSSGRSMPRCDYCNWIVLVKVAPLSPWFLPAWLFE